jgi:hypothetical protein
MASIAQVEGSGIGSAVFNSRTAGPSTGVSTLLLFEEDAPDGIPEAKALATVLFETLTPSTQNMPVTLAKDMLENAMLAKTVTEPIVRLRINGLIRQAPSNIHARGEWRWFKDIPL